MSVDRGGIASGTGKLNCHFGGVARVCHYRTRPCSALTGLAATLFIRVGVGKALERNAVVPLSAGRGRIRYRRHLICSQGSALDPIKGCPVRLGRVSHQCLPCWFDQPRHRLSGSAPALLGLNAVARCGSGQKEARRGETLDRARASWPTLKVMPRVSLRLNEAKPLGSFGRGQA